MWGLLRSDFWAGRPDLIWDRLQCVKCMQGHMTTFSKTNFNKALLNCKFHSSLIYDIVSLGKKGILTCHDSGLLEQSDKPDGNNLRGFSLKSELVRQASGPLIIWLGQYRSLWKLQISLRLFKIIEYE